MSIPSWLDPSTEITQPDQPINYVHLADPQKAVAFILLSMKKLLELGMSNPLYSMSDDQILGIIANAVSETGWGRYWKGLNFFGWKILESNVTSYKQTHNGMCPRWYRAAGHIASGDQPIVYYRAFDSPMEAYKEWVDRFVPKIAKSPSDRYYKTSLAFWNNNNSNNGEEGNAVWFNEICLAGYKGPVTQQRPQQSVEDFKKICKRIKVVISQHIFGVVPSGNWLPSSEHACTAFQKEMVLPQTGQLDDITFEFVLGKWRSQGMPMNVVIPGI
jgi:hypothetical protein